MPSAHPVIHRRSRRAQRAGITLLEIMVVMAIMALILAVAVPSLSSIWDLEQRGIARDLAQTYRFLQSEATLRNVCFRIAYDLDAGGYHIEVGDPNAMVFGNPDEREAAMDAERKAIRLFDKPLTPADGSAPAESTTPQFSGLDMAGFASKVEFPVTTRYGFVYTPEYREPQEPTPPDTERKEEDGPNVVYSYVFPNGDIEYTVVRVVDADDPADGYTVEAEPVSGRVTVDPDLTEVGKTLAWLPDEAPETD